MRSFWVQYRETGATRYGGGSWCFVNGHMRIISGYSRLNLDKSDLCVAKGWSRQDRAHILRRRNKCNIPLLSSILVTFFSQRCAVISAFFYCRQAHTFQRYERQAFFQIADAWWPIEKLCEFSGSFRWVKRDYFTIDVEIGLMPVAPSDASCCCPPSKAREPASSSSGSCEGSSHAGKWYKL